METILMKNSKRIKTTNISKATIVKDYRSKNPTILYMSGDDFERNVINNINKFCDKNGVL